MTKGKGKKIQKADNYQAAFGFLCLQKNQEK